MSKKDQPEDRLLMKLSQIPIESNLGLLAYGDIAFEAWRQKKRKLNTDKDEEK